MSQPEQEPGFAGNQSRTMSGAFECVSEKKEGKACSY